MNQIATIFWQEYRQHVTRWGYLLFTFGLPLFFTGLPLITGAVIGLAFYLATPALDERPVALVDQASLIARAEDGSLAEPPSGVALQTFDTLAAAQTALEAGDVQAIYHIPPLYWQTGHIHFRYEEPPIETVRLPIELWLEREFFRNIDPELRQLVRFPADIVHYDLSGEQSFSMINLVEGAVVYFLIYFVRLVGTAFTANYMFDSISNESDDRTLEILLTSVSPLQFIIGKVTGVLAVGFTQLALWGGGVLIVLQVGALLVDFDLFGYILNWPHLWLLVGMLAGAYIMDHLLAAALGLLKVSGGAGMQLFQLVNLVSGVGLLYATYFVPRNPDTWLAIGTSIFPLTAPIVLLIRVVVSDVPTWQNLLSIACLWATNALLILGLVRLLKANLVVNRSQFEFRAWLWRKIRPSSAKLTD